MVDFDHLSAWPLDKIMSARGFVCMNCGTREAILITDASLEASMRKLSSCPPGHRKYKYLMAKCARKAEALRMRGETDGTLRHKDMAIAG